MKRIFVCAATLLLAGANGPRAEEKPGSPTNPHHLPDTIVVSANRYPTSSSRVASSVTVLTREQIERSQATFVAHLLRSVSSVDVVESGGPGKSSSVFLRGTGSQHVLVIVDGVKMNDPSSPNGSFDFANLTTDGIERIEILRGSQSVLYGSDAVGGVIEIFKRRGVGKPSVSVSSEAGSLSSYSESATLAAGNNNADLSLTLSHKASDGFSASDSKLGSKERDGYRNTGLSGTLGLALPSKLELTLSGSLSDAKTDVDQTWGILDDPNATNATQTHTVTAGLVRQTAGSRWTPQLSINYLRQEFESRDFVDPDHPFDAGELNSLGNRMSISTQHCFRLTRHTVLLGGELQREEYESNSMLQSYFGTYHDTVKPVDVQTAGMYLSENWSVSDNGTLTGGVRLDHQEEFGDHFTYRLAGTFLAEPISLKVRLAVSTGFKAPTLFQLYQPLYGSRDLLPEKSISREIGFEQSLAHDRGRVSVSYFHIRLTDLFSYNPSTFRTINVGKAISQGVELTGEYSAGPALIRTGYTYTDSRNESDHSPILRRPRHKLSASLSSQLNKRLQVRLDVRYTGARHDIDFTTFESRPVMLDAYTLTDLSATFKITPRLELRGRVHNLFNVSYQEVYSYGTSPRALYVGVNARL